MNGEQPPIEPADVAVIVPVGGSAPAWARASASLARLDPPPGELVVVVDGPDERLEGIAGETGGRVIVLDTQGGPAGARNRGVEATKAGILLFLDADVEPPGDLIARVADIFRADPDLAAIMGSYDDEPGDPGLVSQYRNLLHHWVHQNAHEEASTFWAGCGAVRRDAFVAVGGFDESYRVPSIEDIELGADLRRAGHRIRLARDLQVKHLKRWRLAGMLHTDLWRRAVPWTELMLRDGGLIDDLNVGLRSRLSVALAFVPLLTLPAAWKWPPLLAAGLLAIALLVALNVPLLQYFRRVRGTRFTLAVLPLYWLYLLTCGLGFGLGACRTLAGTSDRRPPG